MKNIIISFWLMLIVGISTLAAQTTTLPLNLKFLEAGTTRLSSTVPVELSGSVTSRGFEYRLKGATTWTTVGADAFFFADLPDLPSGLYEFRAFAVVLEEETPLYSKVYGMQITCSHCEEPSRDYYFEFPPTVCTETFEATVAYYYPEVPTPANWIDRVGTVTFSPLPAVNVRLIDETGTDGIAKARVVIDNDALPFTWARLAPYPTLIVLFTEDEEPVPHQGVSRTIIVNCLTIKPYALMGTNTQKPLSALDLKKGVPVASTNATWVSGNTSSVTTDGTNLNATSLPGVATVTATLKDGSGSVTSTVVVLNTPVDATIESGQTHTFKGSDGSALVSVPSGTLTNVTYKWEVCTANCGTPSATWAPAPGTNNQAGYTTGTLTENTYFRRTVSADGVEPLVTVALVEVTVEVAPTKDYYFEYAPTVCAGAFEPTVAWYYPEIPTPANWLDRVGTVTFNPLPDMNVRLIDDTGIDGIPRARVVIDNAAIPASWARGLAYPTFIVLFTEDEVPQPHWGNTRTLIMICTPTMSTVSIKPYVLMGTGTQETLSAAFDLKKGATPLAGIDALWRINNTLSVTIEDDTYLNATNHPGVANVSATVKGSSETVTSTVVVLNTPVDATIESGQTHTFKALAGSALIPVPDGTLTNVTYNWEVCTANCGTPSATWAPAPGINNQAGYTTGTLTENTYFRRTVSADGVEPLVTVVLVTIARDFYFEFPTVAYAEFFEETVAYYYPEVPTPANWLDRVGTITFKPLPVLNVRLIDETGADGIAKARVVVDDGIIPGVWARGVPYPATIQLNTEIPSVHAGTALIYIWIYSK